MLDAYFATKGYFWCNVILYSSSVIVLLIILYIHAYHTTSDLCTSKRQSLSHRSQPPSIDTKYISTTLLSLFSIIFYTVTTIIAAITLWTYITKPSRCSLMTILASIFYTISKGSMYTLFLYRLYSVYGSSAYKYNPKLLMFVGIINIIYCTAFSVLTIYFTSSNPKQVYDYAIICDPAWPQWMVFSLGVYDTTVSVLFMIAFNYPLKQISKMRRNQNSEMLSSLRNIGVKSKILIWTAIVSTLIILAFVAIGNSPLLVPIDTVINCICVCLMAPYYPDNMYYNKLCCLCIKCCQQRRCCYFGNNDEKKMVKMQLEDLPSSSAKSKEQSSTVNVTKSTSDVII